MNAEPKHDEVAELLGVYALNAVEPDERLAIETHLDECEVCSNEVAQHHEIVGFIAGEGSDLPTGLWDRVAEKLEAQPPPLRLDMTRAERPRKASRWMGAMAAITSVAAAVAAIAGVAVIKQASKLDKLETQIAGGSIEQSAVVANTSPINRHVTLVSADAKYRLDTVLTPDGRGFLVDGNLPGLGDDRTYQLWAVAGGEKISVAVVGSRIEPVAFQIPKGTSALALTEEVDTGVVASKQNPVVAGTVTT